MDRRTFLKTTTAAAGSSLALTSAAEARARLDGSEIGAPTINRGITTLSFATPWGCDVPVLGDAAARLRARLQQALGERYDVLLADNGAEPADFTFAPPDVESEPGFAFFAGLPGSYGLDPMRLQAWLAVGGGQMLWDELAARTGLKPVLAGHTGERPGLWASRPIADGSSLSGRPLMLAGLGGSLARALGAKPVVLPPSQLKPALASGQLAATEWGNPLAGLMLGLPEASMHFYRGGVHRRGMAFALHVRLDLWEKLGTAERAAIEGISAQELSLSLAEAIAHERLAEEAIARSSLTVAEVPAQIATAVGAATATLIEDISSASPETARIRDSYMAFRRLLGEPGETPLA